MATATKNKVRLLDISKRVGVSASGVSRALRDDPGISAATRSRVHRAARALGYEADSRKPRQRTLWRFGFIYCDPKPSPNTFAGFEPALHLLMRDALALRTRFELLLIEDDIKAPGARQKLLDFAGHLQGVLIYGTVRKPQLELLGGLGLPVVVMGETELTPAEAEALKLQRVTDNPMRSGMIATEYLLERGRRRIAFVGGIRQPGFYYEQWYHGYLLAHAKAGVAVEPRRVLWHDHKLGPLRDRLAQLLPDEVRPDSIAWADAGMSAVERPRLHELGLVLPSEDEVISTGSSSITLQGQEHYPQVLTDLAALTRESIRRLTALCRDGADGAVTTVISGIRRNLGPAWQHTEREDRDEN